MVAFFFPPSIASSATFFDVSFLNSYTQAASSGGATTSITSVDFGVPATDRRIFVILHIYGSMGSERSLSSATIGGVAATIHCQDGDFHTSTFIGYEVTIISAIVPTGTSGTVSMTYDSFVSGPDSTITIGVIRTKGLVGTIIDANATHNVGSTVSLNINVPAKGILIVGSTGMLTGGPGDVTMTSPTPASYDGNEYAGVVLSNQSVNASRTVSSSITAGGPSIAIAAVTWTGQ